MHTHSLPLWYSCHPYLQPGYLRIQLNLTELPTQVAIMLGIQDGTGQGSKWLIECPVILIVHI